MFSSIGKPKWQKVVAATPLTGCPDGIPLSWIEQNEQVLTVTVPFAVPNDWLTPLQQHPKLADYQWQLEQRIEKLPNSQPELPMLYGNVILVASGKGGVGKSSVTAQLAMALAAMGANVGVLDADIYGPSMPIMFGRDSDAPVQAAENKLAVQMRHGVAVSSLGYLTDSKEAAIWRGPMASAALQQLLRDTAWPKLDYLLVDMPPGTGDIQLTFAQKLPVTGAVIVTTPQTVALADAEKGITMFRKVGIPITGLIENMSYFECGHCGEQSFIFGEQGGAKVAQAEAVPLLGQWPLHPQLREQLDNGLGALPEDSEFARLIQQTATELAAQLYFQKH